MICICQTSEAGCQPSAAEDGAMVALSHLPTFLGVEKRYFNEGLVEDWIVTSEFVEDVVSTSEEKKAHPSMERLQKGYCTQWQEEM